MAENAPFVAMVTAGGFRTGPLLAASAAFIWQTFLARGSPRHAAPGKRGAVLSRTDAPADIPLRPLPGPQSRPALYDARRRLPSPPGARNRPGLTWG